MKKRKLKVKLNLNKEKISNLNEIKGGDGKNYTSSAIFCCAMTSLGVSVQGCCPC